MHTNPTSNSVNVNNNYILWDFKVVKKQWAGALLGAVLGENRRESHTILNQPIWRNDDDDDDDDDDEEEEEEEEEE